MASPRDARKAPNPGDVTRPATPVLSGRSVDGREVHLQWTESTDDFDPQFVIEYEVDLNTILYANQNGVNTFAVAAVDGAGNRSPLSNVFPEPFEGCVF